MSADDSSVARSSSPAVDWARFLSVHDLTWDNLPEAWHEGAFLGNGLLGAMIYARGPDGLRWDVSRSDITDLSVMRRHHREPTGHMVLSTVGRVTGGHARLDLWNAEARGIIISDVGEVRWRSFVHADVPVLVIEAQPDGHEDGFTWTWIEDRVDWGNIFPDCPPLPRSPPAAQRGRRGETVIWSRGFIEGGCQALAWRETVSGRRRTLFLSVARSRPDGRAVEEACASVESACASAERLTGTHRAWWHAFYPKSFLSLPDKRMEAFYWIQMYKIGCATRPDRPAIDVLGPWWMLQAWPAIWWNLNIQLTYSPVYASNHLELGESLCRLLDDGLPGLIANAPEAYRHDSAAAGRTSSYDCSCAWAGGVPKSGGELCNLTYACHNYWLQYRHSMDDALLRDRFYPLLRRSINFYLHLLKPDHEGRLHLPVAISPEYRPPAPDTNVDLSLLRWGCRTLLWTCERLGMDDPLVPRWRQVLEKLADYPADENGFMIGAGVPLSVSHRHHSHLFMIYPLHLMDWDNPAQRGLMERSFNHWMGLKGGHAGYSYALASAFCSCMGRREEAVDYLDAFLDRYPTANAMYLEGAPASSGLEDGALIETPLAAANSILELLLQSWGGVIRVFPGVPGHWRDVAFADLRAEGAFLVTAARQGGRTRFVRITSLAGEPCRVRADMGGELDVVGPRAEAWRVEADGTVVLDLRKGETAALHPADCPPPARVGPVPAPADEGNYYGTPKRRPVRARRDGGFHLLASHAGLRGAVRYEQGGRRNHLTGWADAAEAAWTLDVEKGGRYRVLMAYRCPSQEHGGEFTLLAGSSSLQGWVEPFSGTGWEPYKDFDAGTVRLDPGSSVPVRLTADGGVEVFKIALFPARDSDADTHS